ncbi:MAG TPA: enoyl-CoA hydratase [Xanthobacteraceae bacterium]|jgi:enoyl-CoA hydratase/carnithine racemase
MSKPSAAPRTETPAPVLLREDRDGIALLTLNRPEARNALSSALIDALTGGFASIRADKSVRAVVLAANGPVFSAGHDLKELTAHRTDPGKGRAYFHAVFERSADMMLSIVHLPQPVIACVQGLATAAGCQLVASCDLVVAAETARFSTPGVQIGLFCSAPMVPISRKIASNHTMEMLLTGEPFSARRAYEIGLVNRVVSGGKEREETIALARTIAQKSSYIIKIGKEAFYQQLDMDLAAAYRYGAAVMAENMLARDAAEGIGAFIEKRAPKWEDR